LRCGKEVTIIDSESVFVASRFGEKIVDSLSGKESLMHYCDEGKGIVGRLELIGMNVKK
jgi:hypothetical protein